MNDRADTLFTAADRKENETPHLGRFVVVGAYSIRDRRKTVRPIAATQRWSNYRGPLKCLLPDNGVAERIVCLSLIFFKVSIIIFSIEAFKFL